MTFKRANNEAQVINSFILLDCLQPNQIDEDTLRKKTTV